MQQRPFAIACGEVKLSPKPFDKSPPSNVEVGEDSNKGNSEKGGVTQPPEVESKTDLNSGKSTNSVTSPNQTPQCGIKLVAGENSLTLRHQERDRAIKVYAPSSIACGSKLPLLIALHGGSSDPERMVKTTYLDSLPTDNDVIVAMPYGVNKNWADGRGTSDAEKAGVDDVDFIKKFVSSLSDGSPYVDTKKVHLTGISNGGMMSYRLACEAKGLIAGMVVFSTALPTLLKPSCTTSDVVALAHVQGDKDTFVTWEGGESSKGDGGTLESIPDTIEFWRNRLGCKDSKEKISSDVVPSGQDNTSTESYKYTECPASKKLEFIKIIGGGHTWPSGSAQPKLLLGETILEINGTKWLWEFLKGVSK